MDVTTVPYEPFEELVNPSYIEPWVPVYLVSLLCLALLGFSLYTYFNTPGSEDSRNDLYTLKRPPKPYMTGIAPAVVGSFALYYLLHLGLFYGWPKGKVKDGYFLTFLSPLVIGYWILVTPLILPILLVLLSLWGLAWIWTALFEFPADILNGNLPWDM